MTYSCSDFASDVQRCLVHCGAPQEEAVAGGEIGDHAEACIAAVISLNYAAVAARFSRELLDSVETLGSIAEQFGNEALVTLFYLQAAILNDLFVEMDTHHEDLVAFVKTLPSAGRWMKCVRTIEALGRNSERVVGVPEQIPLAVCDLTTYFRHSPRVLRNRGLSFSSMR